MSAGLLKRETSGIKKANKPSAVEHVTCQQKPQGDHPEDDGCLALDARGTCEVPRFRSSGEKEKTRKSEKSKWTQMRL